MPFRASPHIAAVSWNYANRHALLVATCVDMLAAVVWALLALVLLAACVGRIRRGCRTRTNKLSVTLLHPDLGLGGAERLIVDMAVGLKDRGHRVRVVTNFHDPKRAFVETTDGTLSVKVVGSWIPRHVRGRGLVLFATLRMCYAAAWLALVGEVPDVFVVDQVAAASPVLRILGGAPVLFYCHFPDMLCDPNRAGGRKIRGLLRWIYRAAFDSLECGFMRCQTKVVCNSKFSRAITMETFPFLRRQVDAERDVLYPPINIPLLTEQACDGAVIADLQQQIGRRRVVLSINRFERKKNLGLAVEAFSRARASTHDPKLLLVMAGGYDPRLPENVEHCAELEQLCADRRIPADQVLFIRSFTDDQKRLLLKSAEVVVYTPSGEHFGIVPVEAMAFGCPVLAVNNGGPVESVGTDGSVGVLCEPTASAFGDALVELLQAPADRRRSMSEAAKRRCREKFSLPAFAAHVEDALKQAADL